MKFAVYDFAYGWLVDTCAGGAWSWNVEQATEFDSVEEAKEALRAADLSPGHGGSLRVLRIR